MVHSRPFAEGLCCASHYTRCQRTSSPCAYCGRTEYSACTIAEQSYSGAVVILDQRTVYTVRFAHCTVVTSGIAPLVGLRH